MILFDAEVAEQPNRTGTENNDTLPTEEPNNRPQPEQPAPTPQRTRPSRNRKKPAYLTEYVAK